MFILKSLTFFEKLSNTAFFIGKWILIFTMFFIFLGVFVQVFFRYVLNQPLLAPAELTAWCLVWIGYFGASVVLRREEHISVQLLVSLLSENLRFWIKLLVKFIVLFFVFFFTYYGIKMALSSTAFSWAVNLRVMWAMLGIPLAGSFMLVHMIYLILRDIAERPQHMKLGVNK
jgi:TRAP-type C4-dicarboxylate transport system permease small subunit